MLQTASDVMRDYSIMLTLQSVASVLVMLGICTCMMSSILRNHKYLQILLSVLYHLEKGDMHVQDGL